MNSRVFAIILLLVLLAGVGLVVYKIMIRSRSIVDTRQSAVTTSPYVREDGAKQFPQDQDRDGILDASEEGNKTSTTEFDTDHDGLSDALEMEVYRTDPTATDTDKDGYGDGEEVLRGYSPTTSARASS